VNRDGEELKVLHYNLNVIQAYVFFPSFNVLEKTEDTRRQHWAIQASLAGLPVIEKQIGKYKSR